MHATVYLDHRGGRRLARVDGEALVDAGPLAGPVVPNAALWEAVASASRPAGALADARLAPVVQPGQIVCVGLNYRDHALEAGADIPERPLLFAKLPSSLIASGAPIVVDDPADQVDWEAELALVIGQQIGPGSATAPLESIGGYTACNDVSARAVQFADGQWMRGKSFDTFGPVGPRIVRAGATTAWDRLTVQARLNGRIVQDGSTSDLVFEVEAIVAYIATRITLRPGDLVATGTPAGVGFGRRPQRFLTDGDVIEVRAGDTGWLVNPVKDRARPPGTAAAPA